MSRINNSWIVFTALLLSSMAVNAEPLFYDEETDGDINTDYFDPTLYFEIGANTIFGSSAVGTEDTDHDQFLFSIPSNAKLAYVTYSFNNISLVYGTSELGSSFNIKDPSFVDICGLGSINVAGNDNGSVRLETCSYGNMSDFEIGPGVWSWQHSQFRAGPLGGGGSWDYSLTFIVAAVAQPVTIDIKPGSEPNCFNVNGHGVIPVAVLGSQTFDVAYIDISTLKFGGLDVRVRGNKGPLCSFEDVSGDGFNDLVCQFEDNSDYWEPGEDSATLTGTLLDGTKIAGTDSICIVP